MEGAWSRGAVAVGYVVPMPTGGRFGEGAMPLVRNLKKYFTLK